MRTICASLLLVVSLVTGHARSAQPSAQPSAPPSSDENVSIAAGDLIVVLNVTDEGIRVVTVQDKASDTLLGANSPLPLFSIQLRAQGSETDARVNADDGWTSVRMSRRDDGGWKMEWNGCAREEFRGLAVRVDVIPEPQASALHWSLHVDLPSKTHCVRSVTFPQLAVQRFGSDVEVAYPRAAGEVNRDLWQRPFTYTGTYPTGWTSMQLLAAYDATRRTGLYVAVHDPLAATKNLSVKSQPAENSVVLAFEHPAPRMDEPGNGFSLPGHAVWQILRGDWYNAARRYRQWVLEEAKWSPAVGPDGREDTPLWMRELPLWALVSGAPEDVVPQVEAFADFFEVPVGVHWYNWHVIPFDNDYPHYLPAKPGFPEAVARLQQREIYVMPYINGRLWDTRDGGNEDRQFTDVALPAATKDENGKPYVETYGSKEADGTAVKLAVMCPTTTIWRDKMAEIVGRLFNECGVKGVYIDQIAAARPQLCFDRTHQHVAGGGSWWVSAYWDLLQSLHDNMPTTDRMLTSECNAEAYAHRLDGFLTWHWQYNGQVPMFPAVYGGRIQMFGRAYRGGPTKDLALRMKAGQQLVYGEQIGWISPSVIHETDNAVFLRQMVRLRWKLRRYFYAGEMARPPQPATPVPQVTADWQWSGEWPVTTDALMTGAWRLPRENRLVLLLVNVSDADIVTRFKIDAAAYGLPGAKLQLTELRAEDRGESVPVSDQFLRPLQLAPRSAIAWELSSP